MATKGHVLDLPPKKVGVNTRKSTYDPTYIIISGKGKVLKAIIDEAKKHKEVYLATDPDREGEAIAAHVASKLPKNKILHRVLFHSITKTEVLKAIKAPGKIDYSLFEAQQARRVVDRLVGYRVSPIMWFAGINGASAGRVQSVALKYLVDREREIERFDPKEYWEIDAAMEGFNARVYGVNGKPKTFNTAQLANSIKHVLMSNDQKLQVTKVDVKERKRKPSPPFITSTLQQAASNMLGWGVDKTMRIAQSIFEKGAITYHRTDSTSIDKDKLEEMREALKVTHGAGHVSKTENQFKNKKASQEAHEAIRPTGEGQEALNGDDLKLFDLIQNRYYASQMEDAVFEQIRVEMESLDTSLPVNFRVVGSRMLFEGFLKVYGSSTSDVILPELTVGQELSYSDVLLAQKFTLPPGRYTDASLVKRMERDGVGRPATYATIIKVLLTRKFALKQKRSFSATEFGKLVYDYLLMFFPNLVSPEFTSKLEEELDLVAAGNLTYEGVLDTWYTPFKEELKSARSGDAKPLFRTKDKCPVCGSFLLKRPSKAGGWWFACENYPECKTVALIDEEGNLVRDNLGAIQIKVKKPDPIVEEGVEAPSCPKCDGDMTLRAGKFGNFWGCDAFKKGCKGTVKWIDPDKVPEVVEIFPGLKCDLCGSGMKNATGRYGEYLKCVDDDCRGVSPVPLGVCPKCGNFAVKRYSRKKKKSFYCCMSWNKSCDFVTNNVGEIKPLPGETLVIG